MTFLLRSFSLAFLAWHLGMLFPGLAEPLFLAAAALVGLAGGSLFRTFRALLAFPAGLLVLAAAEFLLTVLPTEVSGQGTTGLDLLPLWAGRQLTFSVLPFALGWTEGWLFTGRRERRGWERLIHAAAVIALFWSQGPYHVTLYPHPLALALAFGLFLASELMLLAGRPPRPASWAAALLVIVLGVGVLWSLLGRYEDQSTASGGGLMKPDLFQFDFAPLVRLEDEITLGENLVLLYREEGAPQRRYLRRLVLDAYDPASGFSLSGGKPPSVGRHAQSFTSSQGTQERIPIQQEYYLVNLDPSSLLALNEPTSVTPYVQWNRSSFVNAYRVDSLVSTNPVWLYNEPMDDGLTAEQRKFYTRGGDDPEIQALAQKLTKGDKTTFEKASAILLDLRENYYYSLKPGNPGPRGALKHFLFEGKKGYCSYFAFSMTLLLRSLGIPARIAVGFATDPSESVLGFNPVRAFQAHAWVEVPFGPYGWIEFDPTSSTPAPGENFQFPKGYDPKDLSKMIAEILEAKPQPLGETQESPRQTASPSWERLWSAWTTALPWVLLGILVAANEAWRWRWFLFRLGAPQRQRMRLLWAELVSHARRAGLGPLSGETPEAWSSRLAHSGLLTLAAQVSRARYSRTFGNLEKGSAESARSLRGEFDRARPRVHRAAAILFPWWPQ